MNVPSAEQLLAEVEDFIERYQIAPSTFGMRYLGDPGLVGAMRLGRVVSLETASKIANILSGKVSDEFPDPALTIEEIKRGEETRLTTMKGLRTAEKVVVLILGLSGGLTLADVAREAEISWSYAKATLRSLRRRGVVKAHRFASVGGRPHKSLYELA